MMMWVLCEKHWSDWENVLKAIFFPCKITMMLKQKMPCENQIYLDARSEVEMSVLKCLQKIFNQNENWFNVTVQLFWRDLHEHTKRAALFKRT